MTQVIPKWFKQTEIGVISNEWEVIEVTELINKKILDKPMDWNHWGIHPKWTDFVSKWVPFIMASDLSKWKIDYGNCKFITKEQNQTLQKGFSISWDILLSHKATIWRTAIVWNEYSEWITLTPQVTYYRILDKNKLFNLYLYYYFNSNLFLNIFWQWAWWGSTRAYLWITAQKKLPILLPPLPQQKAIAEILSSLDDKIELLEKQNKTLENIGQAIFKSWFVDFEGFENDLVESEMGMIPRRWKVGKLKDVSIIQNGFAFKSWDYVSEWNIIIRTKNFTDSWYVEMKDLVYLNDIKANENKKFRFELFDFLLVMVWASIWKNVIVTQINLPSLQNQNMWNFKPLNECDRFYNIFAIKQLIKQNIWAVSWSARDFFRKDQFYNFDIVIPSKDILSKFDNIVRPNYEKISLNLLQINNFSNLRDSLLPRLMNGKVRIK